MTNIPSFDFAKSLSNAIKAEAALLALQAPEDDHPKALGFPIHALPEGMRQTAVHLNETIGFPVDYTASAMLFASSVAIGNAVRITPKRGWTEPLLIWLALVGRPGANKTHPLTMMLRPLNECDRESARRYAVQLSEYEQEVKLAKQDKSDVMPIEPEFEQHLVSDTTPEALVEALSRNPRGLGLYMDELAGWVGDFGRYNKGADAERQLSMWSAQPIRVNRVKDKRPRFIEHPFVSICGTIQPGVLGKLVADGRGANGFIDRFLFAFPEAQEVPAWTEAQPDPGTADYWKSFIRKLLSIPPPNEGADPWLLRFTPEAERLWAEHYTRLKTTIDALNADGDEARAGHRTKMLSYTLRLTGIIALATWAESDDPNVPTMVDEPALSSAIALVDYFTSTADKVLFRLHDSTPVDELSGGKLKFFRALPATFTTAMALTIAEGLGMKKRTAERYLGDKQLFQRHREGGKYTKLHEG
jgi:hypothetical protein